MGKSDSTSQLVDGLGLFSLGLGTAQLLAPGAVNRLVGADDHAMSRAVMRQMMKQRYGRIVNITSVVGASGNAGQANYAAAKAGVAGMTRALARELGSRGITVNCIAPGFIETDMTKALSAEQTAALMAQIPLRRLGQAVEIADAVAFLASPKAGYITGTELHVNGGMFMN